MGRKNKMPCVYMLKNRKNGKVYIGETRNYSDRMSHYKNVHKPISEGSMKNPRPIENAIYEVGWDSFDKIILLDTPDMKDDDARFAAEARFIRAYKATDPKYGYNRKTERINSIGTRPKGIATKPGTKMKKSNPIISYKISTGEMFIWIGSKSFADELGCDRAQVARSLKNGKAIHGYYVFALDKKVRRENADTIISKKRDFIKSGNPRDNGKAAASLKLYSKAYKTAEKFAEFWGC